MSCRGQRRGSSQWTRRGMRQLKTLRSPGYRCSLFGRSFLKIFDRVRDASEAVDVAQFGIHTFVAKSVTYGRACFDRLESDTFGSEVIGQLAECLRALQVHAWRSGEVEEDELRQRRLSAYAIEDRLADMVHVEIDETRFGPKNQHAWNHLVVRMPFAIRNTKNSWVDSGVRYVWLGRR